MSRTVNAALVVGLSGLLALAGCVTSTDETKAVKTAKPISYPQARAMDVSDDFFGTTVADPYRWLENEDAVETGEWIDAENAVTLPMLAELPARQGYIDRITELFNYERFGKPFKEGGRYFYSRNDGLQNQSVVLVADALDAEPRVLLDPNTFSEDGTIALSGSSVSPDGELYAYSTSDGGSDWDDWYVLNIDSGELLGDHIGGTKFSGLSWARDSSGFYYSRYPDGEEGAYDDQKPVVVYYHAIGTEQSDDALIVDLGHETRNPYAGVTEDGKYLIVSQWDGYTINGVSYMTLGSEDTELRPIIDHWDPADPLAARYSFLGNEGSKFFFSTIQGAPNTRVIAIDAENPAADNWQEIIPEAAEAMEGVGYVGNRLVAQYIRDATSLVKVFGTDGTLEREVTLPGLGSASGFGGHQDETETFYSFTDFTNPGAIYSYDLATDESTLFKTPDVKFNPDDYESRQVFYTSKDGTRVPMFIVHKKGIRPDGTNPTLLYGYGGFNVSLTPWFSTSRIAWMENGGVWALANIRGGGEYGESWHQGGTLGNKQNVFDDFIAAAEWLIENGYTSTPKLGIQGGSNGGLLVAACLTQRPDLFGATIPEVGVLDMMRYHLQSANAKQWSTDYGLADRSEEEFAFMHAYSPLHNIEEGTCYPPTLITTAKGDDRVAPWHSYKFAAALQKAQGCNNPVVLRVETRAGHGAGKPTWMVIEEIAEKYAFLSKHLGMTMPQAE